MLKNYWNVDILLNCYRNVFEYTLTISRKQLMSDINNEMYQPLIRE